MKFSDLSLEEKAYRRGLDQGVALLAYAIGIENNALQLTKFKQRVKDFRRGELKSAETLWKPSDSEISELQDLVKNLFTQNQ
jgi:hypothetical protein